MAEESNTDYTKMFSTLSLGLTGLTESFVKYMQFQTLQEQKRKAQKAPPQLGSGMTDSIFDDPLGLTDAPRAQ